MKKDHWIEQHKLKAIVERAVVSASNIFKEGSPRQLRIFRILLEVGVNGLYDMGAIMTDKETPLGYDEIEENVNTLKVKLMKDSTPLYQTLYSAVNSCPIDELTWKDPLANIVKGAFTLLEEIWVNPTFNSDLARLLNEGTYQSTVIFLSIREILKNLPFGLFSFISHFIYVHEISALSILGNSWQN
ncbi:2600_t:CDS:2 [Entrophospora sp. SA101]|nr:2600_t:CDS:2 [Entrophospora sp. SA101]